MSFAFEASVYGWEGSNARGRGGAEGGERSRYSSLSQARLHAESTGHHLRPRVQHDMHWRRSREAEAQKLMSVYKILGEYV